MEDVILLRVVVDKETGAEDCKGRIGEVAVTGNQ